MTKKIEIFSTTNYNMFDKILGNRDIIPSHVKYLVESIRKENRLHLHPIIISKIGGKNYIKDGQHRLEAAKCEKKEIYYIIDESSCDDSISLDQRQRNWSLENYFKYYLNKKIKSYEVLHKIQTDCEIPFDCLMCLLRSTDNGSGKKFREGTLVIKDWIPEFCTKTLEMRHHLVCCNKEFKNVLYGRDFMYALKWMFINLKKTDFLLLLSILMQRFDEIYTKYPKATQSMYEIAMTQMFNKDIGKKGSKIVHPDQLKKNISKLTENIKLREKCNGNN